MADSPEIDWRHQVEGLIPPALRLAVRLCGDLQTAEDAVQESLLKMTKYGSGFNGDAQLSTYFTRIVINACNELLASRQKRNETPLDSVCANGPVTTQPDFTSQQTEQVERIRRAVQQLPDRQRNVLVLSVWEMRTAEEIGRLLDMKLQNVYSTLSLARAQLRKLLSEEMC